MIDIEKFICSLIEKTSGLNTHVYHCDLLNALKDQGLEYKDGKIVKTQRRVAAEAKEALYNSGQGWSEEDDEIFGRIHYACVMFYDDEDTTLVNWLNAIKRKLKGELL